MSVAQMAPDPWGIVAEVRALRAEVVELRTEIRRRDLTEWLSQADVARKLGLSAAAMSMRCKRGRSQLAQLASTVDGKRVFRRADIEAMLAKGGTK